MVYFLHIDFVNGKKAFFFVNANSWDFRMASEGSNLYTNNPRLWIFTHKLECSFDNMLKASLDLVSFSFMGILDGNTLGLWKKSMWGIIQKSNNLLPTTSFCLFLCPLLFSDRSSR